MAGTAKHGTLDAHLQLASRLAGRCRDHLLSIRNPEALAEIIGDHRTESLAHALIEARSQHQATLAEALAGVASDVQPDELRKRR